MEVIASFVISNLISIMAECRKNIYISYGIKNKKSPRTQSQLWLKASSTEQNTTWIICQLNEFNMTTIRVVGVLVVMYI